MNWESAPKVITLTHSCSHSEVVETRPNPRKEWPDPRTCPVCKRKRRVTEIHTKVKTDD